MARVFTTSREPRADVDVLETCACSDQVLVLKRGHFYLVSTAHHDGTPLSPAALRVQFERCIADGDSKP